MDYLNKFTEAELKEYEIVENWKLFVERNIKSQTGSLYITKKIITVDISFTLEYKVDVTFKDCHFSKSISFGSSTFYKKFSIIDCTIEGAITNTSAPTFKAGLLILRAEINTLLITKGEYGISTWNFKNGSSVNISGGTFNTLEISLDGKVDLINIDASSVSGDLFIDGNGNTLETINLKGTARNASLFLNNLQVNYLSILLFVNETRLKLSNIKSLHHSGRILIANSYLGKSEFNSIDFRHFPFVVFEDSSVVDCSFNNIVWSDTVHGSIPVERVRHKKEEQTIYSQKSRETFRQLKYAMSKQGDIVNEQKFHSLEMGRYFEILSWKKNFWTKLIIFLSWLTSDFGQSFWRPLLFIFTFHIVLFLPLVISGFFLEFRFSSDEFSIKAFGEGINSFFFLMNPFRKVDDNMFKGAWIIIDVFMRISASYMIYNMVRATRRFIK